MRSGAIPIGQILGVRILVHVSWFIIFALVVLSVVFFLGGPDSPFGFRLSTPVRWIVAILVASLFFGSVVVHELAHALVARRFGMTVNEITLFIFGGAANLEQDAPNARSEALTAAAGPLSSLAVALAFFALATAAAQDRGNEVLQGVAGFGYALAFSNLLLAIFNLIPGFPLDGGRILRAALWGITKDFVRATRVATLVGRAFAYLLIAYGFYQVLNRDISGLWLAFIGWFLNQAAEASYRRVAVEKLVEGITVRDVMEPSFATVGPNLTLDTLVDQHLLSGQASFYPVTLDGDLVGTIEIGQVSKVPRSDWRMTRVTDVMSRGERLVTITAERPLWDAVSRFEEASVSAIPVVDAESGRRLLGLLTRDGVLRALRARAQLAA